MLFLWCTVEVRVSPLLEGLLSTILLNGGSMSKVSRYIKDGAYGIC